MNPARARVTAVTVVIFETYRGFTIRSVNARDARNLARQLVAEINLITSQVKIAKIKVIQQSGCEGVIPVQPADVAVIRIAKVRRVDHARQFSFVERVRAAVMIISGKMILVTNVFVDAKIPSIGVCESDRGHRKRDFVVMQHAGTIRRWNKL